MKKTLIIIKREYLTRVRTKAFVIGTVVTPLLMLGLITLPVFFATRSSGAERSVTVLDQSGDPELFEAIKRRVGAPAGEPKPGDTTPPGARLMRFKLTRVDVPPGANVDELRRKYNSDVEKDPEKAYVVLRTGVLDGVEPEYYAKNVSDFSIDNFERAISAAITERRLVGAGFDPDTVNNYTKPVSMKTFKVTTGGESEEGGFKAFIVPYAMLIFTYLSILMYGIAVLRGVLEEKQSRIVEVIISSAKPVQMMMGKLIGIGSVGLTQVVIWAASALFISAFGAAIFGMKPSNVPKISIGLLVYFIVYFVLGYFLYATLYAMLGAMVSSEEDAQQVQAPITILIVLPMLLFTMIINNPNGGLAVGLSLIPFFSPTLMMLRIALVSPPLWQVLLSIGLMVASILIAVMLAARIYRVGILMYGKRPSLSELGRWLRYT
jgi:ABC-2 type transport system permease protein